MTRMTRTIPQRSTSWPTACCLLVIAASGCDRAPSASSDGPSPDTTALFDVRRNEPDVPRLTAPPEPRHCPEGTRRVEPGEYPVAVRTRYTVTRPLCVDEHEVTVSAYRACVAAGACAAPKRIERCNAHERGRDAHPMNCVTLAEASNFCRSVGKRLPTEQEWEAAARGTSGADSALAGGDSLQRDPDYCVAMGPSERTCIAAETPEEGSSSLRGLTGNVREWTTSKFCSQSPQCDDIVVVRGGGWRSIKQFEVSFGERIEWSRSNPDLGVGFRCVAEL